MSNNYEIKDFIVKAKNIDADISNSLKKSLSSNDKRNLYIFLFIVYIFFIIILWHNTTKTLILMTIFYFVLAVLIIKIVSFEVKWDLKIHNQKIYVYYDLRHHYIDYCDLVSFEIKKVHKRVTRYGYAQIDALIIYYLKNGKIHRISLEVKDYIKPEIETICKAFVTNKQLDNNPSNYDDYFYICKENINEKLEALERYNAKTQKYIQYITFMLIGLSIVMLLSLIHIFASLFKSI